MQRASGAQRHFLQRTPARFGSAADAVLWGSFLWEPGLDTSACQHLLFGFPHRLPLFCRLGRTEVPQHLPPEDSAAQSLNATLTKGFAETVPHCTPAALRLCSACAPAALPELLRARLGG